MNFRSVVKRLTGRGGGDEFTSTKLRSKYHAKGVEIGMYSYGCFDLERVPPGVRIGRYCSFANTSRIFLRDHGLGFIGLTAYLYNQELGLVDRSMIATATLDIGDDVWLGHNAIITSKVQSIGRGAAIAAGAVVTKPVPAYAIVAGNPARVLRMRFDPETITAIEASRWWERDLAGLRELITTMPDLVFSPEVYFAKAVPIDGASGRCV